jgi:signal transduction histidine kinase
MRNGEDDMAINPNPNMTGEVLLVEDTPASLQLLTEIMRSAGHGVRQAQDGEMALMSVKTKAPDLILLDVRMPGVDGFEVCRRLKTDPVTAGIPVIFLSALQDVEAKLQGFQLGAVDYIVKPYQEEEVKARVRMHLELRHLQLRLEQMCDLRMSQLSAEIVERRRAESDLLKSRQKLRELSGHLEDVREEERTRIAREIHDELGQALTAVRIDLTRLASRLHEPRERIEEVLNTVIGILDNTADTARNISENLRPGMLDVLGLGAAVEHHVSRFMVATGIRCRLTLSHGEFNVDNKVATAAFRIVQEALTNVARHAQARHVDVRLVDLEHSLAVIVQDDGRGIPVEGTESGKRRYGLLGMSERATLLGGSLQIESTPDTGTRVEAILPTHPVYVES